MPQKDSEQVEKAASTFFMRPLCTSCERNGVVAPRIPVDLHAVGAQRVDDDEDDVLAVGARHVPRIGRREARRRARRRLGGGRWLEGKTLRAEEAGDQLVLPEQVVAARDPPVHRDAEERRHHHGWRDHSQAAESRAECELPDRSASHAATLASSARDRQTDDSQHQNERSAGEDS